MSIDQDQTFAKAWSLAWVPGWVGRWHYSIGGVREKLKYSDVPEGLRGLALPSSQWV